MKLLEYFNFNLINHENLKNIQFNIHFFMLLKLRLILYGYV